MFTIIVALFVPITAAPQENPPGAKARTVYVPTVRPGAAKLPSGLDDEITRATICAIAARTPYRVVSDRARADTELVWTVVSATRSYYNRDQRGMVREGELTVVVDLVWRDRRDARTLSAPRATGAWFALAGPVTVPELAAGRLRASARWSLAAGETPASAQKVVCERLASEVVGAMEGGGRTTLTPADPDSGRVPILPPVRPGFPPPIDGDEPTERAALAALAPVPAPGVFRVTRADVRVEFVRAADALGPPRFYPLVGPAQAHDVTWKCTVSFTEVVESDAPFPVRTSRRRVEVVAVTTSHLHLHVAPGDAKQREVTKDLTRY